MGLCEQVGTRQEMIATTGFEESWFSTLFSMVSKVPDGSVPIDLYETPCGMGSE